jgi:hypothetical protein
MGLDMYLSVRRYVKKYDWSSDERKLTPEFESLTASAGLKKYSTISDSASGAIVEATAIYWRKANAIHQWFVDNCADGIDDCRPVYVSRDSLKELLNTINSVLKDPDSAKELLPTSSGFFFGATEYDEWYWDELKETRKSLKALLKRSEDDDVMFQYEASW